jgi:DNA-binding MarR family transcriptional regulator
VVQRLGERKLVDRVPDPVDKRRFLVRLTRKGIETYDAMEGRARAVTRETLAPLEADEQAQFIALLKRLG